MLKKATIVSFLAASVIAAAGTGSLLAYANENGNNGNHDSGEHADVHKLGSTLEVHISDSGTVIVRGAKVTGVSGNTINAVTSWGSASLNWAIVTDGTTEFVPKNGGTASISAVSVGDFVSFQGPIAGGSGASFTVNAKIVKDWSINKIRATIVGTVQSVNSANQSFALATEERGTLTVLVSSSTKLMKGDAVAVFADILVGGRVSASGVLDPSAKTLQADSVKIRVLPVKTTVQGTVKTVSPLVITVDGIDYTVVVASDTSIINALWLRLASSSIRAGDTIRVYGKVNANATIDATVVRDISIR